MFQLRHLFFIVFITAMSAHSQNTYLPPVFEDAHRLVKIQALFPKILKMVQDYAETNHIPGYAFGLMVDGQLVYTGSGGYIDLKKKIAATPQSIFRIASMTKSFTAMAILKLREEGKLSLDDTVNKYIPELKNQKLTNDSTSITLRNLLTHAAGFPEDNPWGDRQLSMTTHDFVELIKKRISFANTTGSAFEYSNLGYALLGLIIERISGMPYQDYIDISIWQPLEMKNVAWDVSKVPSHELVKGYRWGDNRWTEEIPLADGAFGAMGGMWSSLESFSHYVALHQNAWPPRDDLETGPIQRSAIREMHHAWQFNQYNNTHHFLNGDACPLIEAYGYGLRWFHDCDKKTYVGHSGGLPGFGSNWSILPDYGIGVIFLANLTYTPAAEINTQVLHTLVKEAKLQPRKPISQLLVERQRALVKLLPDWKNAEMSGLFADNFFLDSSLQTRKKETLYLFKKAGKIIRVSSVVPENQLRGHFVIHGEQMDLKLRINMSPTNPALIQELHIEELKSMI